MRLPRISATLVLTNVLAAFASCANAQQTLSFPSLLDRQAIPAALHKPEGDGPFPAVVIMHDCSGLGPRSSGSPARWARELLQQGYVVLIPDSFTPRGFDNGVCTVPGNQQRGVRGLARAADAYAALGALRALAYVQRDRIGIMGGSHGGSATLATMVTPRNAKDPLAGAKADGFAAGLALYPGCTGTYGEWSTTHASGNIGPMTGYAGVYKPLAPLLILAGEKDDWTPAEPCRQMAEVARAQGLPMDIHVYPGAHHSFDNDSPVRYVAQRNNASSPTGRGATTGGNAEAWADARRRVAEFFDRHLRNP